MSLSCFPRAARRALAVVLALIGSWGAAVSVATAADAPVITGLSNIRIPAGSSPTITISGSGFTNVTGVETLATSGYGQLPVPAISFAVVDDGTIRATFPPFIWQRSVRVRTADGVVEAPTALEATEPAKETFPTERAVRCEYPNGERGGFDATLAMAYSHSIETQALIAFQVGTTGRLGDIVGELRVPDGRALITGSTARPYAIRSVLDIPPSRRAEVRPYEYPSLAAYSEQGNPISIRLGSLDDVLDLPEEPGVVTGRLARISLTLESTDGSRVAMSCAPVDPTTPVFEVDALPRPTISPAEASTIGDTRITITGGGFKPGVTTVTVGLTEVPATVESPSRLTFIAPPRGAGTADVRLGPNSFDPLSFRYVPTAPEQRVTTNLPSSCSGLTSTQSVTVTATVPTSVRPGEGVGARDVVFTVPGASGIGTPDTVSFDVSVLGARRESTYVPLSGPGPTFTAREWDFGVTGPAASGPVRATLGPLKISRLDIYPDRPILTVLTCSFSGIPVFEIPIVDPPTPTPSPIPSPTPSPSATPSPSPSPTPVPASPLNLGLAGAARINGISKGMLPLSGALRGAVDGEAFTGDLSLDASSVKLTALGVLPITARVAFRPTTRTTGTLAGGALTANTGVNVRVTSAKVLGFELVKGSACQTRLPTLLKLRSATFSRETGGVLTGTFSISELLNCGTLTRLVSPLAASKGNTIALKATPQP